MLYDIKRDYCAKKSQTFSRGPRDNRSNNFITLHVSTRNRSQSGGYCY